MPTQFPQRDLTNQYISTSYQDVVQRFLTGSNDYFLDGYGFVIAYLPTSSVGGQLLTTDQTASYAITASFAMNGGGNSTTASYAIFAETASISYTSSVTYIISSAFADSSSVSVSSSWASESFHSTSASYASFATLAQVADVAFLADTASVAALADSATSASWASSSYTASFLPVKTYQITASWAVNTVNGGSGTTLNTGSTYPITASWAISSSQAISASWAPSNGGSNIITGSNVPITSSWSDVSSLVDVGVTNVNVNFYMPFVQNSGSQKIWIDTSSIYYNPATDTITVNFISASSVTASLFGTASWAQTASVALTASYLNVATYNVTASWSNNSVSSISASWASESFHATSASWAPQQQDISVNSITTSYFSASGEVIVPNPLNPQDAATKGYVDSLAVNGLDLFFRSSSADINGYFPLLSLDYPLSASNQTISTSSITTNERFISFNSLPIGVTSIQQGNVDIRWRMRRSSGGASNITVAPELYLRTGSVENLLGTDTAVTLNTTDTNYVSVITVTSSFNVDPNDTIVVKFNATSVNASPSIVMTVDGQTSTGISIDVPSSNYVLKSGDTMTGNLTAPGFSGSLFGTASWALNAVNGGTTLNTGSLVPITASAAISASWAPQQQNISVNSITASFISASNVQITNLTSSVFGTASWALNTSTSFASGLTWDVQFNSASNFSTNDLVYGNFVSVPITASSTSSTLLPIAQQVVVSVNQHHATIKANGNQLFCGTWGSNTGSIYVLRTPDTDLTNVQTVTGSFGVGNIYQVCYISSSNLLYFIGDQSKIIQVSASDITKQSLLVDLSSSYGLVSGGGPSICTDGVFIYGVTFTANPGTSSFFKVQISNGTLVQSQSWLNGSTGVSCGHSVTIDPNNTSSYYATNGNSVGFPYVAKINTTNLTNYTSSQCGTIKMSFTDDCCLLNGFLYVGSEVATSSNAYKVNTSSLALTSFSIDATFGLYTDGTHIYNVAGTTASDNYFVYYPNGDLTTQYRYSTQGIGLNELWITDAGKFIVTEFSKRNVYQIGFGINTVGMGIPIPRYNLDVRGSFRADKIYGNITDAVGNYWRLNSSNQIVSAYSGSDFLIQTGSNFFATGSLFGTSSWAKNSITTSYITASNIDGVVLSSSFATTSSWSITSSFAQTASVSFFNFTNINILNTTQSIFATQSLIATQSLFSSQSVFATSSLTSISSSWATSSYTASYLTPGTYFITSSWALNSITTSYISASNIDGTIISSSYAQTSSWAVNAINGGTSLTTGSTYPITASAAVTASYAFTSSTLNGFPFDNVTATILVTGSNVVLFQKPTASFNTAFFDYSLSSGSNQRAGVMFGTWNGSSIFYTEQTTIDIGDTTSVSMSMALSTSFVQFLGFSQNTTNWTIKSFIRYL